MARICGSVVIALVLAGAGTGVAGADTLLIDTMRQEEGRNADMPRPGATMDRVESRHGKPEERRDPVGDPPITRWDYDDYSVYFENDRVLRAVRQR